MTRLIYKNSEAVLFWTTLFHMNCSQFQKFKQMTTVCREFPSTFWLPFLYTDEKTAAQNVFETTEKTFSDSMPPSLCKALDFLMWSHNAQYVSTELQENKINFGHLDRICETLSSNHHHTLLFNQVFLKRKNFWSRLSSRDYQLLKTLMLNWWLSRMPKTFSEQKQRSQLPVPIQSGATRCNHACKRRL